MTVKGLLSRHARVEARGRATLLSWRLALVGTTAVAACLVLERIGVDVPLLAMPGLPRSGATSLDRFVGYLAISFAGLLQGLFLLAAVLAVTLFVRYTGGLWLRRGVRGVAGALDRRLATDRHCAALEATGPLAAFLHDAVVAAAPPLATLAPARWGAARRLLLVLAVLLVLLVAVAPGAAPGEPGPAFVAGRPEGGEEPQPLRVSLTGEARDFHPREPVPVLVLVEAGAPPREDLDLGVVVRVDDRAPIDTGKRVFLAAGAPGQDSVTLDLRALTRGLEPGEHVAFADAGGVRSNPYRFRVVVPGGGGAQPPPPRDEDPQAEPPPEGGPEERPHWRPKYVEPLVREGEKVEKIARVPVEVPGGGGPADRPLAEAWPELERRKEAALDRAGLSPASRRLVREYFERLRPKEEER